MDHLEATTLDQPQAGAIQPQPAAAAHAFEARLIPCAAIIAGYNPRKYFDPQAMDDLVSQIKVRKGIDTPILVRQLEGESYKLLAGERRLRATKVAFGDDAWIPARVFTGDDADDAVISITENTQRQQMSPAEEAEAAAKLLGDLAGDRDEVARRLGMSRATLDKRLALMNASDKVREALAYRRIQLGHAELLAALTRERQDETLEKLLKLESLPSVEQCRKLLEHAARVLKSAIFDKTDCGSCQHNSDQQAAMFSDSVSAGHCTNASCFDGKTEGALQALYDGLEGEFPIRKILRPGENYTVVKLVVDGAKGVGAAQADACKACMNYGAAIMGTPDHLGKVVKSACFDTNCNAKMVAKRLKADADAAASTKSASTGKADASKAQSTSASAAAGKGQAASTAKAPVTEVKVTGQLEDYRKKLWRNTLRAEISASAVTASRVLLAGAVCGQGRNISGHALSEHLSKLGGMPLDKAGVGSVNNADIGQVLVCLADLKDAQRSQFARDVAAAMVEEMTDRMIVTALQHFEVKLSKHFKLGEDLLKVLTKSEIELMLKDIGLDKKLGDMKKFMALKKDEMSKKLLSVEGFDYSTVPSFLSLDVKLS